MPEPQEASILVLIAFAVVTGGFSVISWKFRDNPKFLAGKPPQSARITAAITGAICVFMLVLILLRLIRA